MGRRNWPTNKPIRPAWTKTWECISIRREVGYVTWKTYVEKKERKTIIKEKTKQTSWILKTTVNSFGIWRISRLTQRRWGGWRSQSGEAQRTCWWEDQQRGSNTARSTWTGNAPVKVSWYSDRSYFHFQISFIIWSDQYQISFIFRSAWFYVPDHKALSLPLKIATWATYWPQNSNSKGRL